MNNLIMILGLGTLQNDLISNWIGPAFFIVVAGFAIKFIISRQFRELASFLGIAAVVALLVFGGDFLFGKDSGIFYKIAKGFSNQLESGGGGGAGIINIMGNFIK